MKIVLDKIEKVCYNVFKNNGGLIMKLNEIYYKHGRKGLINKIFRDPIDQDGFGVKIIDINEYESEVTFYSTISTYTKPYIIIRSTINSIETDVFIQTYGFLEEWR